MPDLIANTTDLVVNTPYIDFSIWVLITLIGLGFLILSRIDNNRVDGRPQNSVLWSLIAPFFLFPSAYFSLMLRQSQLVVTNTSETISVQSVNIITHPEWLAVVMFIIAIFSVINFFYYLTYKPIEKPTRQDLYGDGSW